ncbi:MAG: ATP-binding protein [Eubacteriales bacterium]
MKYSLKRSINKQLSLVFIVVMSGILGVCWVVNTIFLPKYYENSKKLALLEAYVYILEGSENGEMLNEEYTLELQRKCEKYNLHTIILDSEAQIVLSTTFEAHNMMNQLFRYVLNIDHIQSEMILETQDYQLQIIQDELTNTEYMQMHGILPNSNLFMIRTPIEGVEDSVRISNAFLSYIGIVAVIMGAIVIYLLSHRITKPILELVELSKGMSNLEFEKKYQGDSENEIGLLGENMNQLSSKLQTTIQELKVANNELQHDLKVKNEMEMLRKEFISNLSHEFKTPIALIHGYAEGLVDDEEMDIDNRKFYCEVILDETMKMNQMVQKLLTLNQLESGVDQVQFERFDMTELLGNYVQNLELLLSQKEITLTTNCSKPIYVWADEFQIEEVIRNYVSNAMNHVKVPNRITIRVEEREEKVRVCIFNTGEPIPEESLSQIWSKFYKVDKARTREYGGSGVGLSIVKAIMEGMNQLYGVTNYEDGVEFWFELDRK